MCARDDHPPYDPALGDHAAPKPVGPLPPLADLTSSEWAYLESYAEAEATEFQPVPDDEVWCAVRNHTVGVSTCATNCGAPEQRVVCWMGSDGREMLRKTVEHRLLTNLSTITSFEERVGFLLSNPVRKNALEDYRETLPDGVFADRVDTFFDQGFEAGYDAALALVRKEIASMRSRGNPLT